MDIFLHRLAFARSGRYCGACLERVAYDMLLAFAGQLYRFDCKQLTPDYLGACEAALRLAEQSKTCSICRMKGLSPLLSSRFDSVRRSEFELAAQLIAATDFGEMAKMPSVAALADLCAALSLCSAGNIERSNEAVQTDLEHANKPVGLTAYLARLYHLSALQPQEIYAQAQRQNAQAEQCTALQEKCDALEQELLSLREQHNAELKRCFSGKASRPHSACSLNSQKLRKAADSARELIKQTCLQRADSQLTRRQTPESKSADQFYQQFKRAQEARYSVPQVSTKVGMLQYENEMLRQQNSQLLGMLERQGMNMPLEKQVEVLEDRLRATREDASRFKNAYGELCRQIFQLRLNKDVPARTDQRYVQYYVNIFTNVAKELPLGDYTSFLQHCDLVRRYALQEYACQFVNQQTKMSETALRFQKVYSQVYEHYLFQFVRNVPLYANYPNQTDFALIWDQSASFAFKMNCVLTVLSVYGYVAAQINGQLVLIQGQ